MMNSEDSSKDPNKIVKIDKNQPANVNQGQILPKVHKLFIKGLKPAISNYYDTLDDTLFDMAEKAENNEKQTHYFEAMREVRKKKELMVRKFSENVQLAFKMFKKADFSYFNQTKHEIESTDYEGLSLVDEKELDEKLAISNLVGKANTYFHQHLFALEKRFSLLAGGTEIKIDEIPISPAVIVSSFAQTLEHLTIDNTIHLIMLKLFERSLISNLNTPYQEINDFLITQGIYPNLKFKISHQGARRTTSSHLSEPNNTVDAPAHSSNQLTNEPTIATQPGTAVDANYQTIISAMQQRHQNPTGTSGTGNLSVFDASIINNALSLLQIEELKNLSSRSQQLNPIEIKDELLSQLKNLDTDGENKQVRKKDEDTIDLVGMLFQFLVEDRNLPDKIQVLLAKLQIPYLHIALEDRKLFSSKENNARKLLDTLAQASIGWSEENDKRNLFINKIEEIVQLVLKAKNHEIDFPALIEDFQKFDSKNKKRTRVIEKRTSEKALGQERIISAKEKTAEILQEKIKDHQLPKLVTEILLTPWANVLILAHLRHKNEPNKIAAFIQFVDKLIFVAVKNKKKMATVEQIEHVCNQLSKGLRMVAFDEHGVKEKKSELYQMLLEINQIEDQPAEIEHDFIESKDALNANEYQETEQPEIVHFIADKKLNNQNEEIKHIKDAFFEQAKSLQTGEWVEFILGANTEPVRAKLSWISPPSATNYCLLIPVASK